MTTPHPKRRTRRFLQFSLRTLLVFVLLVSVGMSWLGVKMEKARKQKEAVEAIREAGGWVTYDYESDDPFAEPPMLDWTRALLGDDFFFDVVGVSAYLRSWLFGDEEAAYLRALTNLTYLDLSGTEITDSGLESLRALTALEYLSLRDNDITDGGLGNLKGMTSLGELDLSNTQVTDSGLEHLEELANLERLILDGTQITDAGLEHLERLTNLTYLDLRRTQVTDAGLEHLKALTNLVCLKIADTPVTREGVKKLQEALPQCEINYWF
jgi:hypothetical protein